MCLIAIAWRQSARYPLIIAANRDEQYERPTLPAQEWNDAAGIYGGRDLRAGGSWLALSAEGRFAAVTNLRGGVSVDGGKSRGHLVRDFLLQPRKAAHAARELVDDDTLYGPFNLVMCDGDELVHVTNRPERAWHVLPPGIHGVSNGPLNAAWPKVVRLTTQLQAFVTQVAVRDADPEPLFRALGDTAEAPDHQLPETGVELDIERRLSPPFVCGDNYGTRASTVVLLPVGGAAQLIERSFDALGQLSGERRISVSG
jgi:uncharacterized protein with NRDE domain